mgnify:CR=1 FL=1
MLIRRARRITLCKGEQMDLAKVLVQFGTFFVELGDRLAMQDARIDSLGARREPPKVVSELTDLIREAIVASRAETSDEDWLRLNGRRDQECVRYGITREQAAAILAGATKREKKNGNGKGHETTAPVTTMPEETLVTPVPMNNTKNIRHMFDSKEWGEYPLEKGGSRDQIPTEVIRSADEVDKSIVVLVHKLAKDHDQDWSDLRTKLCCARRLTSQQIAGIIAVHKRNSSVTAPTAHA